MSRQPEWCTRRRVIMHPERRGVPDVPLFGRYNYVKARPALPDHVHARDIEICYLVKGRQTYCVGAEVCRLRGGDVFLTFPGETHSSGGHPEERGILYWLAVRVPARPRASYLGLSWSIAHPMLERLMGLSRRHFRGSRRMKDLLDAMAKAYHGAPSPLTALQTSASLHAFLLELLDCAAAAPRRTRGQPISALLSAVRERPGLDWSVTRMAQVVGLSTSRFKARFKEETGVPPREFVLRTRVEEADRRLASGGASITDIAIDLGFSSSQYFATVYRRFTGTTARLRRRALTA